MSDDGFLDKLHLGWQGVAALFGGLGLLYAFWPEVVAAVVESMDQANKGEADTEPAEGEYSGQEQDEAEEDEMDAEEEEEGAIW